MKSKLCFYFNSLTYTLQYPTEVASSITKDEYALSGD
jgi:hypothetical protein